VSVDIDERIFEFDCVDRSSVGIVSLPQGKLPAVGVLVLAGGPQYRVGAHRQFVSLARHLASQGLAAMRFDVRGTGDCVGEHPGFDRLDDDIRCAIDAFAREVPTVRRLVLWGLCDGASAACLYAPRDQRVSGIVLLNPWVQNTSGDNGADEPLKSYYLRRLFTTWFWRKLLSGRMDIVRTGRRLVSKVARRFKPLYEPAMSTPTPARSAPGESRAPAPTMSSLMASNLLRSGIPFYLALSQDDLVARQFEYGALPTPEWAAVLHLQALEVAHLAGADHTLSTPGAKREMEALSARWAQEIGKGRHRRTLLLKVPKLKSRLLYARLFGVVVGLIALDM